MKINKAVITAAGAKQRTLPLQTLIDRDGLKKSVLSILVEEVLRAKVEEICVVVQPGDEQAYKAVVPEHLDRLHFVHQEQSLGYGYALYCARDFTGPDPFLHLVGDHLYVSQTQQGCAEHLVSVAQSEACAISAVQSTRENLLPSFGTVGGQRLAGQPHLYRIETVIEKPTPTQAEQKLIVSGLRAGHYLCFFGMHVLTPTVMELLARQLTERPSDPLSLSLVLAELARREQYLALEKSDWRYDVGAKYGLLLAQLALAMSGQDRNELLAELLELLALREMSRGPGLNE